MPAGLQEKIVERFFRPRGTAPTVAEDGFLPDMDGAYAKFACASTVGIGEIFESRCVVLLGEPGIGKSIVMDQRREALPVDAVVYDMRWVPAETVLSSPEIAAWRQNRCDLHLVIDSIDEATDTNFARMFVGALRDGPTSRLKLELACRVAEWPAVLEEQLSRLFGGEQVKYFQIEPLQRRDVVTIAEARGVDAGAFLDAVWRNGIGALASVPMTLRMLLDVFEVERALPESQSDIYEKACLELCREKSTSRLPAAKDVDPHARLDRASEIAAVCILCRRNRLVESSVALQAGDLPLIGLSSAIPALAEGVVRETLKSGLFSTKGPGTWGWFHQSLPEFLGARWISRVGISDAQVRQLLFHDTDMDAIVPQLKGIAAWLSCLDRRVAGHLAAAAPEIFASTPSVLATDVERAVAATSFLQRTRERQLQVWLDDDACRRLNHLGLGPLLVHYISDKNLDLTARYMAMVIARANRVASLAPVVVAISLDASEETELRVAAIYAAFELAADAQAVAAELGHLAEAGPVSQDEDVRAAVIDHLWPQSVDAKRLFQLLGRRGPRKDSSRCNEIWLRIISSLLPEHLVDALGWVRQIGPLKRDAKSMYVEALSAEICRKALENIENEQVRTALAAIVLEKIRRFEPVFRGPFDDHVSPSRASGAHRQHLRQLVDCMARQSNAPKEDSYQICYPYDEDPLVDLQDVGWLLEARRVTSDAGRNFLDQVVSRLVWQSMDVTSLDLVLAEAGNAQYSPLLPVPLWIDIESEEAAECRRQYRAEVAHKAEHAERQSSRLQRKAKLENELQRHLVDALAGATVAWIRFVALSWNRAGAQGEDGIVEDIFHVRDATEERRAALLSCCRSFLCTERCERVAEQVTPFVGLSDTEKTAYLTLVLAKHLDSAWVESASCVVRWAAAVAAWPVYGLRKESDRAAHRELLVLALREAREHTCVALRRTLRQAASEKWLSSLWQCLPQETGIGEVIVEFLDSSESLTLLRDYLEGLLRIDRRRALDWSSRKLGNLAEWRRLEIAATLAAEGSRDGWTLAWPECLREPASMCSTMRNLTHRIGIAGREWGGDLTVWQLSALYSWLENHVPTARDKSGLDFGQMFRHSLVQRMASQGTGDALTALEQLQHEHPTHDSLRVALAECVSRFRERTWTPLTTSEFAGFVSCRDARIVKSDEQLLGVVTEALEVYQSRMHAETPSVGDLWNYRADNNKKTYWPKDEEDLSDHLARFLRDRLRAMIVNREVEIRPGDADRLGEEPDLLVQAIGKSESRGPFQVAVEVKGSWNVGVETAIETQLRNRYLSLGNLHCGIYVVGWFECANWDPSDKARHAACRRHTRDGLRATLEATASGLETDGRRVRAVVLDLTMGKVARATEAKDPA